MTKKNVPGIESVEMRLEPPIPVVVVVIVIVVLMLVIKKKEKESVKSIK